MDEFRPGDSERRSGPSHNPPESTVRHESLFYKLQHPTTVIPVSVTILSLMYRIVFAPAFGGASISIAISIFAAVTSATFIRRQIGDSRRALAVRHQQEKFRQDVRNTVEALGNRFAILKFGKGTSALLSLTSEYQKFERMLVRAKVSDLVLTDVPDLAETTFRQGLNLLTIVVGLAEVVFSPDIANLKSEVEELELELDLLRKAANAESLVSIVEAKILSRNDRLSVIRDQALRIEKALYQCDRCQASIQRTRIEVSALIAESLNSGLVDTSQLLQKAMIEAKEIQDEVKKLGY